MSITLGPRHLFGLFLWSAATLLLELALTRILSVSHWYHFGFLVISTALLGFGVAGTTLSTWRWLRDEAPLDRALTALASAFAISAVLSFRLLQWLPFDPFSVLSDPSQWLLGPLSYVVLATPFAFAGLGVALLFTRLPADASRLYAFDLTGAGAGCLLLLVVLPSLGGAGAVVGAAILGLLAATVFAADHERRLAMVTVGTAVVLALALPAAERLLPIRITPLKRRPPIAPILTRWNSTSRVEVFEFRPPGAASSSRRFVLDGGTAATGMQDLRPDVRTYLATHRDDRDYPSGVAYLGKAAARVLVIGSGGGAEVLDALHYGASAVTALEVNPTIVDVVRREMRDYWGGLFEQPEVTLVADEGRSFLRRSTAQYDAIISIHTISNAAVASGALALTENYVLTREAFADCLDHLAPDGILLISRPEPQLPRVFATAREALQARGVSDPAHHLYAFRVVPDEWEAENFGSNRGAFEADVLIKKSPLTADEIAAIERHLRINQPSAGPGDVPRETVYSPLDASRGGLYREILSTDDLPGLYRRQPQQLAPATDDRPFFNHLTRWSSLNVDSLRDLMGPLRVGGFMLGDRPIAEVTLLVLLIQSVIVAGVMILWPLARARRRGWQSGEGRTLAYFAALGLGFITVEMATISRMTLFIGEPAYTIILVLGGLLVSSGAGAAVAARWQNAPLRVRQRLLVALAILLIGEWSLAGPIFSATLAWPLAGRCAVALVWLAPLGLLLGMPFPLGLHQVAVRTPALVPWAWGINSFFTVIGTVTSLMLAMTFGFTVAIGGAVACYLLAASLAGDLSAA